MARHLRADQTEQKLRGGYYTPQKVADYVAAWVLESKIPLKKLLEPSCGDGAFIRALTNNQADKSIHMTAYELFPEEARKATDHCIKNQIKHDIVCGDFLEWANTQLEHNHQLFDGIVGNPPFIRYQFIDPHFQKTAEKCFDLLGQKFSKLTNSWIVFMFASIALLKAGGRMGMVIPTEIMTIIQAKPLREYLAKQCGLIFIISPKEIIFKDTLQGVVLLMVEKKLNPDDEDARIGHQVVDLKNLTKEPISNLIKNHHFISTENLIEKWSLLYLGHSEIELLLKIKNMSNFIELKEFSKASVCLTTGADDFFVANQDTVNKYDLHEFVTPLFVSSGDSDGIICGEDLYQSNVMSGQKTNLINIDATLDQLNDQQKAYVELGENSKYHERYKCRIREPWHKLSLAPRGEVMIGKFAYDYPKLMLNKIMAFTVNNFYHIKFNTDIFTPEQLITAFYNPYTMIMAEMAGRFHGGGLLELTPSEVGNIIVPTVVPGDVDICSMNREIQEKGFEQFIYANGDKVLADAGLTSDEISRLHLIWRKVVKSRKRK